MSQCQHRIGERCGLKGMNGQVCPHLVYDGCCQLAEVSDIGRATFSQARDIVFKHHPNNPNISRAFEIIMTEGNYRDDDPVESLTWSDAEVICAKLSSRFKPNTVYTYLDAIYRCGCDAYRRDWNELKVMKPTFDRYHVKLPRTEPPRLTPDQKREILYHMETLRRKALDTSLCESKRRTAKEEYVVFWLARYFGTRTFDSMCQKWSCIQQIDGEYYIVIFPNKTKAFGTVIRERISAKALDDIMPFIGHPDEYMVPPHLDRMTTKQKENGVRNPGARLAMRRKIGRFFRSIGCTGNAAFYNMRYWFCQDVALTEGSAVEARKAGHSEITGRSHYYNPNDKRVL